MAMSDAWRIGVLLPALCSVRTTAQQPITERGDSVSVRLVDVDLRAAVSALSPYLDRPVVFGVVQGTHVTLETPHPVPCGSGKELVAQALHEETTSQTS
jgi:type II secretory pathway component GspD/PulD (secretin)